MFLTSFISSAAKTKRKIQPSARSGVTEFVKIGKLQKVPKSLKANRIHISRLVYVTFATLKLYGFISLNEYKTYWD